LDSDEDPMREKTEVDFAEAAEEEEVTARAIGE
jgi:DNA-dependent RNA polymerase auxiliary subunit epsilon